MKIGRYIIRHGCPSGGGMGQVYIGTDPHLNRPVAIKTLPPERLGQGRAREEAIQRFKQEAEMLALFKEHDFVVPIWDYGVQETDPNNPLPYIVMMYMAGGSLAEQLGSPLGLEAVLAIFERACHALDRMHDKKVLHRDFKPGNILMDENNLAFVSDFGIAKLLPSSGPGWPSGFGFGTLGYVSPEQMQMQPIDRRSDIYSAGVTLYECLTCMLPFNFDQDDDNSLERFRHTPVPQIRQYNPSVPPAVQAVLDKAMAKNLDDRYPTAGDLFRALEAAAQPVIVGGTAPFVPSVVPVVDEQEQAGRQQERKPSTSSRPDEAVEPAGASIVNDGAPKPRLKAKGPMVSEPSPAHPTSRITEPLRLPPAPVPPPRESEAAKPVLPRRPAVQARAEILAIAAGMVIALLVGRPLALSRDIAIVVMGLAPAVAIFGSALLPRGEAPVSTLLIRGGILLLYYLVMFPAPIVLELAGFVRVGELLTHSNLWVPLLWAVTAGLCRLIVGAHR